MKLKKWILAVAVVLLPVTAMAKTYAVWPLATEGQEQIPVEFNPWYNLATEQVEVAGATATKCFSANGSADASSGWMCGAGTNFDFKNLAPLDLVFDVMISGPGEWHVRLTAPDQDAVLSVPDDGQFHTVRLNIQKDFDKVYQTWSAGNANGKDIFPFSLVGTKLDATSVLFFTNCRYEDAIPQPSITAEVTDITSESAKFSYNVTFPEGYTNTTVTLNGENTATADVKELTGLTPRTDYSYTIVATGEYNGQSFTARKTVNFTTVSKTGVEYAYHDVFSAEFQNAYRDGEDAATARRTIKASLPWTMTYRADGTALFSMDLSSVDNIVGLVRQLWSGDFKNLTKNEATGRWEFDFGTQPLDGDVRISLVLSYNGGKIDTGLPYTKWGMEKEAPAALYLNASAENITANSAEIHYDVTGSFTDYKVYYKLGDAEAVEAAANPIVLSDLAASTDYTCDVYATADNQGQTVESAHSVVSFKTSRLGDHTPVWHGTTDIAGFYAEYSISYLADSKLYIEATLETEKETVVADRNFHIITPNGEWIKLVDDGTGILKGTSTNTFDEGATVNWEWYLVINGGGVYQQANTYVVGSENEAPVVLRVKASAKNVKAETAEIEYEVVCPVSEYKVYYKVAGGEAVEATASPIALTGLTPETAYAYEFYVTATIDGAPMTSKVATVNFTTLSLDARDRVYNDIFETTFTNAFRIGEDEATSRRDIKASLPWSVTYRADGTGIYSIDLSSVENIVGLVPRIWSGDFKDLKKNEKTGRWEYDFGAQTLDAEVAISHYLPYSGGGIDVRSPYTRWGMEKAAPVALYVKATAENVTADGAEIRYEVTGSFTDYKVYYKTGEGEAVEATANPIVLTGLTEKTEYTYEVYATATLDGQPVESEHAIVTFKTKAVDAVDLVYNDILNVEVKNAFLIGEPETARRSFFVALPWSVTYRADETAVYSIDLSAIEKVVGIVPQIYWNGFKNLTKNADNGRYEYEFGTQTLEETVAISHYLAYSGGNVDVRSPYTKWGMEKEAPVLGEAVRLELSASTNYVMLGKPVYLTCVAKDAADNYLSTDGVTLTCTNPNAVIENGVLTLNNGKGDYYIKAAMGELVAEVRIDAIASPEAENLLFGLKGMTDEENVQAGTVDLVTDADRNSQLEWRCTDTREHYLVFDLAKDAGTTDGYYIEAVEVYFEGAYATKFTVTLSSQAPAEIATAAEVNTLAAATDDVVFQNTTQGTQHMFARDPKEQHRYVTLRTQEAYNDDWGIKVRDIKVYGTVTTPSATTTGVEGITVNNDEDASVEYYNLNGIRVENPSAGLYIRRQGSTITKVIIK